MYNSSRPKIRQTKKKRHLVFHCMHTFDSFQTLFQLFSINVHHFKKHQNQWSGFAHGYWVYYNFKEQMFNTIKKLKKKNQQQTKPQAKKDLKNKEQLSLHGFVLKSLLYHAFFYKFGGGCVVKEKSTEIMGRQSSLQITFPIYSQINNNKG